MIPTWHPAPTLGRMSTLGVGAGAQAVVKVASEGELKAAWRGLPEDVRPRLLPLGGLSNVVISDFGVDAPVVCIRADRISVNGIVVTADAGVSWDDLVRVTVERGLAGLEMMSGIPGSVGAAPVQNIAAYGQQLSDTLLNVRAMDVRTGEVSVLSADECGFRYRTSTFKQQNSPWIITQVQFRLTAARALPPIVYPEVVAHVAAQLGSREPSLDERRGAVLAVRDAKQLLVGDGYPRTAGSFFKSPLVDRPTAYRVATAVMGDASERFDAFLEQYGNAPGAATVKIPAAQVLLAAGFRNGDSWGSIGLLPTQIVAFENLGGATAASVDRLRHLIQAKALDRVGVALEAEPVFVGSFPEPTAVELADMEAQFRPGEGRTPAWVQTHGPERSPEDVAR